MPQARASFRSEIWGLGAVNVKLKPELGAPSFKLSGVSAEPEAVSSVDKLKIAATFLLSHLVIIM